MPYVCAGEGCDQPTVMIMMHEDSGETNAWCTVHMFEFCRAWVDTVAGIDPAAEVQLVPKMLSIVQDELQHAEMTIASKSGKAVAAKHLRRVYDAVRALDDRVPDLTPDELDPDDYDGVLDVQPDDPEPDW